MTDVVAIISLAASLKATADTVNGLFELSRRATSSSKLSRKELDALNAKIRELGAQVMAAQSFSLAAQSDQLALTARVRELEEKLMECEDWAVQR